MKVERATVTANVRMAERTYRLRLTCPQIAATIRAGQFVMLRLPDRTDPLLARPFALYDHVPDGIEIGYLVVGKMTGLMQHLTPGDPVELWGPLGKPFGPVTEHAITFVAGGIGQTPFLAYANELANTRVTLYYGVRSQAFAAEVERFERLGVTVHLTSDDGTIGRRGYVTDAWLADGAPGPVLGCGPEPMLHRLAVLAAERGVACRVALETPMACGIGICSSCVVRVKQGDGWDYQRCCIDGPTFDAATIAWA